MDAFVSRKRRRMSPPAEATRTRVPEPASSFGEVQESTDMKLAILSSLHSEYSHDDILEILLGCEGSVETALEVLSSGAGRGLPMRKREATTVGLQSSISFPMGQQQASSPSKRRKTLTKKGKTLHLYAPDDVDAHTPCSIIHNFLSNELATALLREILPEVSTYASATFRLFDKVVKSPHTACFYVNDITERERQRTEYLYNGSNLEDVRAILPQMRKVSGIVQEAVNEEIRKRIRDHYPDRKKLKYQSPAEWIPNAAFVNCYDGGAQSVGFHSDQLSYLGPRAIIGSLSLGVAREFRVRKIVPKEEDDKGEAADASGQIAIHLPHNSLLVMHAEMQEEWKHSITPVSSIDPHPIADNKRINITYRWYRESFHPKYTPKCKCGVPTVLKTVQKQKNNRGRYMWMCQVGGQPNGGDGCGFFEWAEFTDDGEPVWSKKTSSVDLQKQNGVG